MKIFYTFLLCTVVFNKVNAQFYSLTSVDIPININGKDAKANGYYNSFTNDIVLEQQDDGVITRLQYDSSFNLKKKYTNTTQELTLGFNKKKASFVKQFCTVDGTFGVYVNKYTYSIIKYDFENSTDTKKSEIILRQKFKDERLVSIIPYQNRVAFLTISDKSDGLIYYDHNYNENKTIVKEFLLPKMPLTADQIKDRGKHLAVKYDERVGFMNSINLNHPDKYELNVGAQLYYNNDNIFILINMPYKAGIHVLQLNLSTNTLSFENYIVNTYNASAVGTAKEKIAMATAVDSLLIIKNANNDMMEYYMYNIFSKTLLAHHKQTDDSLSKIVQSDLIQMGTYSSKDKEKEIKNEKRFLRRVNEGLPFIKAHKNEEDSLLITFGGYKPTEGVEGTMLSMFTMGFVGVGVTATEAVGFMFYLSSSRNKFLFAHSKFSNLGTVPSTNQLIKTKLNYIVSDKLVDDLERNSTFAIEVGNKLYLGIFNKKKRAYDLYTY